MQCARCHDAPFHDVTQQDLFSLAAMLKRKEESVPKTSTVTVNADGPIPNVSDHIETRGCRRSGMALPGITSQRLPEALMRRELTLTLWQARLPTPAI